MNKEEELIRKKSPVNIRNKKASFEYFFIETYTAGIVLTGTEIKSIRLGKASLVDTFCFIHNGEIWVKGMNVSPYFYGSYNNHELAERNEADGIYHRATARVHRPKRSCQDGYCIM